MRITAQFPAPMGAVAIVRRLGLVLGGGAGGVRVQDDGDLVGIARTINFGDAGTGSFSLTFDPDTGVLTVDVDASGGGGGGVPGSRQVIAGAGLTGGGDLTADRTFNVVANADASIVVNANDIQVGVLATDAQHGVRGGGTQHSAATTSVAGFMSSSDKTKLDGLGAGADVVGPSSSTDNAVARFDSTTGKLIQNSAVTVDDSGNIATSGTVDGRDVSADGSALDSHVANTSNPHSVTIAQVSSKLATVDALTWAADRIAYFTGATTSALATLTGFGRSILALADAAAARALFDLEPGTDVQAYDAELAAIAGLTSAADKGIQFTGVGTAATYDLTAAGKALLDDASASAQRTTLGLGALATLATVGTTQIDDAAVTYAKIQDVSAASRLLGRGDSGAGDVQEITVGSGLSLSGTTLTATGGGGSGDVVGPASATDNAVVRFDSTTGKLVQNSAVTIDDSGNIATSGTVDGRDLSTDGTKLDGIASGATAYTDELAQDAIGGILTDSSTIDFAYDDATPSITASVIDGSVTLAKLANIATDRLIGRDTAGTGVPEAITVGGGLEFSGSGGIQRSALTGDVTASAGSGSTTIASDAVTTTKIADDAVTYAKLQNISTTDRLLGRDASGAGNAEELTVGGGLEFTGSGGIQRSALTGDVTASAGSGSTTIANDAVTYAKLQNVSAASRLLGRGSASGSGDAEEITLGTGLSMSGTTLSATGGSSGFPALTDAMAVWQMVDHCGAGNAGSDMEINYYTDNRMNGLLGKWNGFTAGAETYRTATDDAASPGVIDVHCGTDAGGWCAYGLGQNAFLFGSLVHACEFRFRTPSALSDGTNTYTLFIGFTDQGFSDALTDGCYVRYSHGINGGDFECVAESNTTETTLDSNVAVAADTWYTIRIVVNAAASSVEFFINGTSVGTITTNIPSGSGRQTGLRAGIKKSAGTTNRILRLDRVCCDVRA